jgi:hypothetical protein
VEIDAMSLLHDATFKKLELDWSTGQLTIFLMSALHQNEVRIVGTGVTSVSLDREFPWGRSVSVNECLIESTDETATLKLEMQSGDNVIACGMKFVVNDEAR